MDEALPRGRRPFIRMETVDGFLASSDFYTIDVADAIGRPAAADAVKAFAERHSNLVGRIEVPGIEGPFPTTRADVERIAGKFLLAVQEAGRIYRRIADAKGTGTFVTEVSMDETDSPQTPRSCSSSSRPSPTRESPFKPSPRSSPADSTKASITSATCRNSRGIHDNSPSSPTPSRSSAFPPT